MLSPPIAPAPPQQSTVEGSGPISPTTRRRGLSYLRGLSSRDHNTSGGSSEAPRVSPRSLFTRSTSYQETKESRGPETRRRSRSHSRPLDLPLSSTSLVRVASEQGARTQAETAPATANSPTASGSGEDMARTRAQATGRRQATSVTESATTPTAADASTMTRTVSNNPPVNGDTADKAGPPALRLFPHHENNRTGRQSLNFPPVSRTLPNETSIIRVGRYSEREGPAIAQPTGPSDAPVGFKSKVVSRKHCEFSFVDGQWNVKDVASSSGTFLNHIRLSQPNQESRLYPIKDGDIIQLGIDFRGGEEMIFRCVKIRIECNRSWQKKPNNFNKQRQALLRGLTKDQPSAGANSGECSICLGNVLPCQALFVAPCAHCWHYKCIRPMLQGPNSNYPTFQCPNCRLFSNLEADLDDVDMADWQDNDSADPDKDLQIDQSARPGTTEPSNKPILEDSLAEDGTNDETHISDAQPTNTSLPTSLSHSSLLSRRQERALSPTGDNLSPPVQNIPMPTRPTETEMQQHLAQQRTQTESPNAEQIIAGEGPLTPRNNAGPFVFDGSGSRTGNTRRHLHVPSQSLDEISN